MMSDDKGDTHAYVYLIKNCISKKYWSCFHNFLFKLALTIHVFGLVSLFLSTFVGYLIPKLLLKDISDII